MNAERLCAALRYIRDEYEKLGVIAAHQRLVAQLGASIGTPGEATQLAFRQEVENFTKALDAAESNRAYPTLRMILDEIEASQYLGVGLKSNVRKVLRDNNLTPHQALSELKKLLANVQKFHANVLATLDGMESFTIQADELEPGAGEIGFSFPRLRFDNTCRGFGEELKKIDVALKPFAELTDANELNVKLRKISSSDWQLFIDAAPSTILCVVITIERIVALYKSNLEIKKLKKELENKSLPAEIIKQIEKYLDDRIEPEIRKIAEETVETHYRKADDGRKNELNNALTFSLKYFADKLDTGVTVEFRAQLPEQPDSVDDADDNKALLENYEVHRKLVQSVNKKAHDLAKLDRSDAPVLAIELQGAVSKDQGSGDKRDEPK